MPSEQELDRKSVGSAARCRILPKHPSSVNATDPSRAPRPLIVADRTGRHVPIATARDGATTAVDARCERSTADDLVAERPSGRVEVVGADHRQELVLGDTNR
jgi:hypothetical protein